MRRFKEPANDEEAELYARLDIEWHVDRIVPLPELAKLGSVAVYAQGLLSGKSRKADRDAIEELLSNDEVLDLLGDLKTLGVLPRTP